MEDKKYIYFPLHLLAKVILNPKEGISDILHYGIVQFSKKIFEFDGESFDPRYSYEPVKLFSHIVYCYNHGTLDPAISRWIKTLEKSGKYILSDNNGYDADGIEFFPQEEIECLMEASKPNSKMFQKCKDFYRMDCAMSLLELRGDYNQIMSASERVFEDVRNYESKWGKDSLVSVKVDLILDFYKNDKTSREYELLLAHCALKSFLGNKQFVKTNKPSMVMRMCGARKPNIYEEYQKQSQIKKIVEKYSKRYHADKLLLDLIDRSLLRSLFALPHTREIFISNILSLDELEFEVSKNPPKYYRIQNIKDRQKKAIANFKVRMQKGRDNDFF